MSGLLPIPIPKLPPVPLPVSPSDLIPVAQNGTTYKATVAELTATIQSYDRPVPIESFGPVGTSDDSATFNAALQSGVPFQCAATTYYCQSTLTDTGAPFVYMRGVPGQTIITRAPSGTAFPQAVFSTPYADIAGIIFDSASLASGSDNYAVQFNPTVIRIRLEQFVVCNNLAGDGLLIEGEGTYSGGSFVEFGSTDENQLYQLIDVECYNNKYTGCQITNGRNIFVRRGRYFNNTLQHGLYITPFLTTGTILPQRIVLEDVHAYGNHQIGIAVGQGPLNPIQAVDVTLRGCKTWSNADAGVGVYASTVWAERVYSYNDAQGGANNTAIFISGTDVDVSSTEAFCTPGTATFGIDCSATQRLGFSNNTSDGFNITFNIGGSSNVTGTGNNARNFSYTGINVRRVENSNLTFNASFVGVTQNFGLVDTILDVSMLSANRFAITAEDNPGWVTFDGVRMIDTSGNWSMASPYLMYLIGENVSIKGAYLIATTGSDPVRPTLTANAGTLVVPDAVTSAYVTGNPTLTSIQTASQTLVGTGVAWLNLLTPGTAYTSNPSFIFTGSGAGGAAASPLTNSGVMLGAQMTTFGAYTAQPTVVSTGGGAGTQATWSAQWQLPLPIGRQLTLIFPTGGTLASPLPAVVLGPNGVVSLQESNGVWIITDSSLTASVTTAVTQPRGDDSTLIATDAFVYNALSTVSSLTTLTGTTTLTPAQYSQPGLLATGALTGAVTYIVPNTGFWTFENATTNAHSVTVTTAAGTGIVVPQGSTYVLMADGTNVVSATLTGTGSGTVTSVVAGTNLAGGTITTTGTLSLASTVTGVTLAGGALTGTLNSSGTISGGTVTGAVLSADTLSGTTTNSGTISGGTLSAAVVTGGTLAGAVTGSGTVTGGILAPSTLTVGSSSFTALGSGFTITSGTLAVSAAGGSVTSVIAGTGLAGGTITTAGTISLAGTITNEVLATPTITGAATNSGTLSGGILAPATIEVTGATFSAIGSGFTVSSGTLAVSASGGSVTSIIAGTGLTGGTITTAGTIALAGTLTGETLTTTALTGTTTNSGTITGGTLTSATLTAITNSGTLTNSGTITGGTLAGTITEAGTLTGGYISPGTLNIGGNAFSALGTGFSLASGTLSATAGTGTVSGVVAGSNLTGGTITSSGTIALASTVGSVSFSTCTLTGLTTNSGTISGGTISNSTLAGSLTNSGTITGGTISGASLAGTTTNGGTISGGTISGAVHTGGTLAGTITESGTLTGGVLAPATLAMTGATFNAIGSGFTVSGGTLAVSSSGGSVTSVVAGTNLAGGTITTAGTLSLASTISSVALSACSISGTLTNGGVISGGTITAGTITAETLAGTNTNTGTLTGGLFSPGTLSVGGSAFSAIGTGLTITSGTLTAPGGSGSVTKIVAGTNLSGGTITSTGTISLAATLTGETLTTTALTGVTTNSGTISGGTVNPAAVTMTGPFVEQNATYSAAGSTQGTATNVTAQFALITSVASGTGIIAAPPILYEEQLILNAGTNTLTVYPVSGVQFWALGANNPVLCYAGNPLRVRQTSSTQAYAY